MPAPSLNTGSQAGSELSTTLMCAAVVGLLKSEHLAYIRSAGSVGCNAFNESVALQETEVCVEGLSPEVHGFAAPMYVPLSMERCQESPGSIAIFHHVKLTRNCRSLLISEKLAPYRVRYEWDRVQRETPWCFSPGPVREMVFLQLNGFEDVTTLADGFLSECPRLRNVDLSRLICVTVIGARFMANCGSIESVCLSGFSALTRIEDGFLIGCKGLLALDMAPLAAVVSIQRSFLRGCVRLQSLDLSRNKKLAFIGDHFLMECSGLRSVVFADVFKGASIPHNFMLGCCSLEAINLKGFSGVERVGSDFLGGCRSLTHFDAAGLQFVMAIGPYFLSGCTGLVKADFSALAHVYTFQEGFMMDCSRKVVVVRPTTCVTEIPSIAGGPVLLSYGDQPMRERVNSLPVDQERRCVVM